MRRAGGHGGARDSWPAHLQCRWQWCCRRSRLAAPKLTVHLTPKQGLAKATGAGSRAIGRASKKQQTGAQQRPLLGRSCLCRTFLASQGPADLELGGEGVSGRKTGRAAPSPHPSLSLTRRRVLDGKWGRVTVQKVSDL